MYGEDQRPIGAADSTSGRWGATAVATWAKPFGWDLVGPALALLTVLTWSTYSIASAAGAAQGLRPWDMTLLRFAGGAAIVLPFLLSQGQLRDLGGLGWGRGIGLALAGGPLFGLVVYTAFALAPLAHATVFPPACVMVTGMVLSTLVLDERPGRSQLAGCALLALGLVALAYDGLAAGGALTWLGDLLFALAGCSWGVFTFLLRRWRVAPLRAVAAVTIPSAVAMLPIWLVITGGSLPPTPAGTILAQWFFQGAMGGVLGVAAFGGAVRALGAAKASALPSFTPAVTTLLGILALGHLPTRLELLGMALATLGLLLAILGPGPNRTVAPADAGTPSAR
ncbi:MAG: DMT family transporter [Geminicoccaceae bacterium]